MKVTIKENPPPPPPPQRYLLDVSQEEMDMLRYFVDTLGSGCMPAVRFLDKTKLYDGGTWAPDKCFKE